MYYVTNDFFITKEDRFSLESACRYQIERVYLPQIILTMKRFILLFALLGLVACGQKVIEDDITKPQEDYSCALYPVDAYTAELKVSPARQGEALVGFQMSIRMPSMDQSAFAKYLQNNRISDPVLTPKANQLIKDLEKASYPMLSKTLRFMYGAISGPVKVYSDREVNGRAAGEDLSDMFVVISLGHVGYPDLELQKLKDWYDDPPYVQEPFAAYFKENTIPFALQESLMVVSEPLQELTGNITIEIPVTGISKDGQEKIVVFKGTTSI